MRVGAEAVCVVFSEAAVQSEAGQHDRLRRSRAHDALHCYWRSDADGALGQEQQS